MQPFQDDEIRLLKENVLVSMVLTAFNRDRKLFEASELKMNRPYLDVIEVAMNRATKDLTSMGNEMRKKGLRVAQEKWNDIGVDCLFLCRGYRQVFQLQWPYVRAEIEIRMKKYLIGDQ